MKLSRTGAMAAKTDQKLAGLWTQCKLLNFRLTSVSMSYKISIYIYILHLHNPLGTICLPHWSSLHVTELLWVTGEVYAMFESTLENRDQCSLMFTCCRATISILDKVSYSR